MADRLLILGASARAAAASARRAGYEPVAIDLFADRDTKQICEAIRVPAEEYPEGLFRAARTMPATPWMYTGGLENYPELVGELAKERELWGNGPEVLRKVRDPFQTFDFLTNLGFSCPAVSRNLPDNESSKWLRKPLKGAGGLGIRIATRSAETDSEHFFQRYIEGRAASLLVIPLPEMVATFGLTHQLIGESWLHASNFRYCGNIVAQTRHDGIDFIESAARWLCRDVDCNALFGMDFIESYDQCELIEINPRYTSSVEILEFFNGTSALNIYASRSSSVATAVVGKAIYYAPASFAFPDSGPWDDSVAHAADVWRRPDFADVPHPGEVIEAGHPVITILTEADTEDACLARLKARAAELDRLFGFPTPAETDP